MLTAFKAELMNHTTGDPVIIEDPDYDQLLALGYSDDRAKEVADSVVDYYQQLYFYEVIWRDRELSATDFYWLPDVQVQDTQRQDMLNYRKQLRDYPRQMPIPYRRPVRPVWFRSTVTFY